MTSLPHEAWAAALSTLDQMGPARLHALLDTFGPAEGWRQVVGGLRGPWSEALRAALGADAAAAAIVRRWTAQAAAEDVTALWRRHEDAGVGVACREAAAYPAAFRCDPLPPAVVFFDGDPDVIVGPRVAIVGTRNCTRYGFDVARQLGSELSVAGVSVVSGLALGIDGAAHVGALEAGGAPPVAIVGSGLDRPYPARHAALWRRVAAAGVVVSEYPLGTPPLAWHFPARNRLIAALADIVVVVESQEHGGSLLTVERAIERGVEVMAVPGPVTSPTSAGTNRLLSEGRGAVRDAVDVLVALGMSDGCRRSAVEARPLPTGDDQVVLAAIDWQPATLDHLLLRTSLNPSDLAVALMRLEDGGWIERRGGWIERVAKPGS